MKRYISYAISAFILLFAVLPVEAYHNFFFRDAADITSGILPNARLDPSSVTLQGNSTQISTIVTAISNLERTTASAEASISELRITTPIFKTRLDNLDTSTANTTNLLKATASAFTNYQNAVIASTQVGVNITYTSITAQGTFTSTNSAHLQSITFPDGTVQTTSATTGNFIDTGASTQTKTGGFSTYGKLNIGTVSVDNIDLYVNRPNTEEPTLRIANEMSANSGAIGTLSFMGRNDIGVRKEYAFMRAFVSTNTGNLQSGKLTIGVERQGAQQTVLSVFGVNDIVNNTGEPQVAIQNLTVGSVSNLLSSVLDVVTGSITVRNGGIRLGAGNLQFPDGTTQNTAATGTGGTSGPSTRTVRLSAGGGDVYIATTTFNAIPGASWAVYFDTINIINVTPYCMSGSTKANTVLQVVRSTVTDGSRDIYSTMHSSSFTVGIAAALDATTGKVPPVWGASVTPDQYTVVNASSSLSLWVTAIPGSGDLPRDCGVVLRYWKNNP